MNLKQKKKQLLAAAMAVLLSVGTAVPVVVASAPSAYAADTAYTDASGTCFTIDARGNIVDITPGRNATELVVPRSISGITVTGFGTPDHDAWTGCESITSITFPDTVTRIESYACFGWESLSEITLPKNLTYIGDSAFVYTAYYMDKNNWQNGCLYLDNWLINVDEAQFPNGVCTVRKDTIGIAAFTFWYCERVREVHLPNSLQYLGDHIFLNCINLKDIYYNSSQSDWQKIANKELGILASATIHYDNPADPPTTTTPVQTTPTTNTKGSIMLDTANYIMAPGNMYDIGVTLKDAKGKKLSGNQVNNLVSAGKLKIRDSRTGSVANLQQLPNGNFRVTGKQEGTCYIVYEIGGTHASVRIDVQRGVTQHGTAVRNTSYLTQDIGLPEASAAVVGTWKITSFIGSSGKAQSIREGFINEMKTQIGNSFNINSSEVQQTANFWISLLESMRITLNENGTFTMTATANGETIRVSGTYVMEGENIQVTANGETIVYQYNPTQETLLMADEGFTTVWQRQ